MKNYHRIGLTLLVGAGMLPQARAQTTLDLGEAQTFAVLGGAGVTVAGAVASTTILGDLGSYPTQGITGLENVAPVVTHQSPTVEAFAKTDLQAAYTTAATATPTETFPSASDLGGLTLTPGVYKNPSSFAVTGTLTLDAQGNPNAVWIIQMGSTLTTAANSQILLINGAQAANVYWQVGSSATLGTLSSFVGTMMVQASITLTTGASVDGQLLALTGTVTLDTNDIAIAGSVPEPAATSFLIVGSMGLLVGVWGIRRHRTGRGERRKHDQIDPRE